MSSFHISFKQSCFATEAVNAFSGKESWFFILLNRSGLKLADGKKQLFLVVLGREFFRFVSKQCLQILTATIELSSELWSLAVNFRFTMLFLTCIGSSKSSFENHPRLWNRIYGRVRELLGKQWNNQIERSTIRSPFLRNRRSVSQNY